MIIIFKTHGETGSSVLLNHFCLILIFDFFLTF